MPNHLATSTSPYLLQHADNPVDWFEWGDDAFAEARERDVPIFLSVGYSSCHWCHVMAHESFEDATIAAALNDAFVNVKVDREERPDVDAVHMEAVTALTGRGGWPMSVFLTPDGHPFFAGTYWPSEPRHGMPAFPDVIAAVSEAWQERRDQVLATAEQIVTGLAEHRAPQPADTLDVSVVDEAARVAVGAWDQRHGGFGRAPKFPQAMTIEWLLHHHVRTGDDESLAAAVHSLDAMARGGIHDQVGGGFARYSTDERWLVPHFEKMLYDNALLLSAYATAAAIAGDDELARVVQTTVAYLLDEVRTDDGLFVSASDADSEGVEGRFFVWSHDEFREVVSGVGADADLFAAYLGVVPGGNWEGTNVLHRPLGDVAFAARHDLGVDDLRDQWARVRPALAERRATRVAPGVDDKVLADWNALAIRGLVVAARLLGEPAWAQAAHVALDAVHEHLTVDGVLHHSWRDGRVGAPAFLDDLAALAIANLEVLSVTGDPRCLERAVALASDADTRFRDPDGGWFQTAEDAEPLFTRPRSTWDNATPTGTSMMVEACLALGDLTGEAHWTDRAVEAARVGQAGAARMPTGFGWLLRQFEALAAEPRQVAIVGPDDADRAELARVAFVPPRPGVRVVVADADHDDTVALLAHRHGVDGGAAAYVCRGLVCDAPVTTPQDLRALLDG